jgi:hypothetical protein
LGGGPPGFPRNFTCPAVLRILSDVTNLSPTGVLPSMPGLSSPLQLNFLHTGESPTTPISEEIGLGFSLFARRYWGNRGFFLFLRVLRCFSSPACLLHTYVFSMGYPDMTPDGLPHSGIHGSRPACGSPWHFAADRALLRLLAPRHPPYALSILTFYRFSL